MKSLFTSIVTILLLTGIGHGVGTLTHKAGRGHVNVIDDFRSGGVLPIEPKMSGSYVITDDRTERVVRTVVEQVNSIWVVPTNYSPHPP